MILDFLITLIIFILLDLLWLGVIAKNLYRKNLNHVFKKKFSFKPAIIFYLLFTIGLLVFVINLSNNWQQTLLLGALFGLITYATYDLTNHATIKKWPIKITIIDLIWGTFISATTSTLSYLLLILL